MAFATPGHRCVSLPSEGRRSTVLGFSALKVTASVDRPSEPAVGGIILAAGIVSTMAMYMLWRRCLLWILLAAWSTAHGGFLQQQIGACAGRSVLDHSSLILVQDD